MTLEWTSHPSSKPVESNILAHVGACVNIISLTGALATEETWLNFYFLFFFVSRWCIPTKVYLFIVRHVRRETLRSDVLVTPSFSLHQVNFSFSISIGSFFPWNWSSFPCSVRLCNSWALEFSIKTSSLEDVLEHPFWAVSWILNPTPAICSSFPENPTSEAVITLSKEDLLQSSPVRVQAAFSPPSIFATEITPKIFREVLGILFHKA